LKAKLPGVFWIALLFWVAGGTAPAIASSVEKGGRSALTAYSHGEQLLRQGRTRAAIESFTRAVNLAPTNSGMRKRLAWLLLDEGRTGEAKAQFVILTNRFPDEKNNWVGLAVALLKLDDPSGAVSVCDQALSRFDLDPLLLKLKGEALMSRPEASPQAVLDYQQLAQLETQSPQWLQRRQAAADASGQLRYEEALEFLREKQLESAVEAMAAAVEFVPQSVGYWTHYGWLLVESGKFEPARTAFETVLELDPAKQDAYLGLAIARLNLKDERGAVEAASLGLARFGQVPELLEILGDAFSSQAETRIKAEQVYRELLQLQPENSRVAVKLAQVVLAQGRKIEAEEILVQVVRMDPANPTGQLELARLQLGGRAPGKAAPHFKQVLEADPGNSEARQGLQAAERSMRPQLELQSGYLADSQTFTRLTNYSGIRFFLTPELRADLGLGHIRYDMDNDPGDGRLREDAVNREVLPLLLTYQPTSRLMLEAGGALNHYNPGHDSGSALAGLYYQVADDTGVSVSYAYHDVMDYLGPFKGPWGRQRDVFADRDGYRYWVVDPIATWAGNVFGPSSTQSALDGIHANDISFWGYQNLWPRITLSAYGSLGYYSDDNFKRSAGFTLSGRLAEDPLVKLKYSFYYVDYSDRSADLADLPAGSAPLYWDPSDFRSNAVGIVLEKNLSPGIKLAFESDLLWTAGADTPGVMVLGELTYYVTDDLALRAIGAFLSSNDGESSNSNYRQGNFTLGLNYRF
jgi:predicted Zn-dependent protease